jgi:hypothetical protein
MPYGQAKKMLKNKPGWEYVQKGVTVPSRAATELAPIP